MKKISIIIPTHNRPEMLKRLIIEFSKVNNVEIIVIENGSTKENKIKYKNLENINRTNKTKILFLFNEWSSHIKARHEGVRIATCEYIFHCDDDDMPTIDFIKWLNKNHLVKSLYRFNILIKNKATKTYHKTIPQKDIVNYSMQLSTWVIKRSILLKLFEKFKIPQNLIMGEDQILSIGIYEHLNYKKIKICNIEINSIVYDFDFGISKSGITTGDRKKSSFEEDRIILDYLINKQNLNNKFWYKCYKKMLKSFRIDHLKFYENTKNVKKELRNYKKLLNYKFH